MMVNQRSSVLRTTLSRADCIGLLSTANLARVVISVRCLPAALPARIAVVNDDQLLVASTEGSVILAARRGDVLSIQIDGLEPDGSTWSVMASGLAHTASTSVAVPNFMQEAIDRGATLLALPLSVVTGERIG
jgi:hypothetical protein